ncbi:biliverdin-producing heme oxygenase [Micromonosporaceae bacterium Da 78-11]
MTSRPDTQGADRLSVRLRQGTRAEHDAAQGSGFLDALAAGRLSRDAYADLTAQHWFVYESLELAGAAMAGDPVAGAFVVPELTRLPSLEADLHYLHGPDWRGRIVALPATTAYRARLREVASAAATGFVAHHYTRYLGDLSGGQYLGPAIARAYGMNGDGHRFFVFPSIEPATFRDHYRRMLDGLPWSSVEQDSFLAEVAEAYRLNIAVLAELKDRWTS